MRSAPALKSQLGPVSVQSEDEAPFAQVLARAAEQAGGRKGERTRRRLKAATAELLEEVGYRDLRVSDINERAGVSNALFYVYFENKTVVAREVLSDFVEHLERRIRPQPGERSLEMRVFETNLAYIRSFAANAGLMRCLLQFNDEHPEFARIWDQFGARIVERTMTRLRHEDGAPALADPILRFRVVSLGLMLDGLLRSIFVDKNEAILQRLPEAAPDLETLARLTTDIWRQALLSNPAEQGKDQLG